jgi:hypothetical protein
MTEFKFSSMHEMVLETKNKSVTEAQEARSRTEAFPGSARPMASLGFLLSIVGSLQHVGLHLVRYFFHLKQQLLEWKF